MYKNILILGIISLFFISAITPITFGFNVTSTNKDMIDETNIYDSFYITEITSYAPYTPCEYIKNKNLIKSNQVYILKETLKLLNVPMDYV
jgi:aspartate carbamoyltransferase regulatory subunit